MTAPYAPAETLAVEEAAVPDTARIERATVYRWLSGIFAREPSPETLNVYRSGEGRALLNAMAGIDEAAPVAEMITDWVSDVSAADLRVIALDLAGEFAQLFLGAGGRRGAPPYQSFYVGAEGRLMQQPAGEMHAVLRHRGTRVADAFPEPPDHVAVQLALMADLAETGVPDDQAAFLEMFLLPWIGDFRDRCGASSRYGFYTCAASAIVDSVAADIARLRGSATARPASRDMPADPRRHTR